MKNAVSRDVTPCGTLMMEAMLSSETSVLTRPDGVTFQKTDLT
jgi:hypothetical protein